MSQGEDIRFNRDAAGGSKAQAIASSDELIRTIEAIKRANLPGTEAAEAIRDASIKSLIKLDPPWRWWCLRLLLEIYVKTPSVFWPLFLEWWDDAEGNLASGWSSRTLRTALRSGPARDYMSPEDSEWFASLPERVTIYRGQTAGRRAGISWTTERERAEWFARRYPFRGEPVLLSGRVKRSDIIAVFTGRRDSEVLVLPRHVRDRSSQSIIEPHS